MFEEEDIVRIKDETILNGCYGKVDRRTEWKFSGNTYTILVFDSPTSEVLYTIPEDRLEKISKLRYKVEEIYNE